MKLFDIWVRLVLVLMSTFVSVSAFALTSGITYHGRILQPDGVTPVAGVVQFKMQIRTPDSSDCLMYEEWQSVDLTGTNGVFALTINDGSGTRHDSSGLTIDSLFANRTAFTFSPSACAGTNTYNPNIGDGRNLKVTFQSSTMTAEEAMPVQSLNFAPLAIEAKQVSGFQAANLLRFAKSDGTLVNTSPLNDVEYAALVALVDGTSTVYAKPGDATNGTPVYTTSTGTIGSTTVGDMWLDTSTPGSDVLKINTDSGIKTIGLSSTGFITQITAGTGIAVSTSSGNATVGIAAGGVGTTELATAGVTGAKIAAGTITGTNLDAGIIISTTGTVSAAGVGTRVLGISNAQSPADTVSFTAPSGVFTSYGMVLPTTLGANGQVLSVTDNTTGQLGWINPATGSVTSVSAATTPGNPIVVIGGSTPTIDIGKADLTHNGYLASSDFSSFNSKASGSLASGNVYVGNASGIASGVPFTGDVSLTNVGLTKVIGLQGVGIGTSTPTAAGQVLRYDGTSQYQSTFLSMADIRSTVAPGTTIFPATNCAASKALSWSSLTDAFTCQDIAITATQVSGLGSAAYLNVGVGSNSVVQLDSSSRLPAVDGSQLTNLNASALASGTINPSLLPASANTWAVISTNIYDTNSGFVGLGTSTPSQKLDVLGNARVENTGSNGPSLRVVNTSGGGSTSPNVTVIKYGGVGWPYLILSNNQGTETTPSATTTGNPLGQIRFGGYGASTSMSFAATIAAYNDATFTDTSAPTRMVFATTPVGATTAVERLRIDNAGNVGIGTTAPAYKLDVAGNLNAQGLYVNGVAVGMGGSSPWIVTGSDTYYPASGKVGIGTTAPSWLPVSSLYVNGSVYSPTALQTQGTVTAVSGVYGSSAVGGNLVLDSTLNATKGIILIAPSGGNVGIGTDAPGTTFDLVGTSRATGAYSGTASTDFNTFTSTYTASGAAAPTVNGVNTSLSLVGTGDMTGANFYGSTTQVTTAGFGAPNGNLTGSRSLAKVVNNEAVASATGAFGQALHSAPSTIGTTWGVYGQSVMTGAGTITTANGASGVVSNNGTGTIGTAVGGNFQVNLNSGAITNAYGVLIGPVNGTNHWGLYEQDTSPNYFNGNVGIGTTAPAYKLDVAGQVNATAFSIGGVPISSGGANAWNTNGANIFNTNSGFVGIGTSTPSQQLQVNNATGASTELISSSTGNAATLQTYVAGGASASFYSGSGGAGIGTITNHDFLLSANGAERLRIGASGNVGIGTTSPGYQLDIAGAANANQYLINGLNGIARPSSGTVVAGDTGAATNTNAVNNTVMGSQAFNAGTTGNSDVVLGYKAMLTGNASYTTAVGYQALQSITSSGNTAVGFDAMLGATSAQSNVALGATALSGVLTGGKNVALGANTMMAGTSADSNIAIGYSAGSSMSTATNNIVIGTSAGSNVDTGTKNIAIGNSVGVPISGGSNQLNIANIIFGTSINGSVGAGNVGIGTTAPAYKLDVAGAVNATQLLVNGVDVSGGAGAWTVSGGNVYRPSGNVGIGTTSPAVPLHVYSNSLPGMILERSTGSGSVLQFKNLYTPTMSIGLNNTASYLGVGNTTDMSTASFVVTNSGNVGIGTTAPGGALDVSNGNLTGILGADSGATTRTDSTIKTMRLLIPSYLVANGNYTFAYGYSDATRNSVMFGGGTLGANAATEIQFYTAANQSTPTGTNRMLINSAGRVGIGTTNPGYLLDVGGTLNATSIYMNGSPLAADVWSTNGSNVYRTAGSVGVGTSSPTAALNIVGQNPSMPATSGTTTTGLIARFSPGASSSAALDFGSASTPGAWIQSTNLSNLASNLPLLLNPNGGMVGIGTTAPGATFDVVSTSNSAASPISGLRSSASYTPSAGATGTMDAMTFNTNFNGTGNSSGASIDGIAGTAMNSWTGTIGTAIGVKGQVLAVNGGTTGQAYGGWYQVLNTSSTINNAYGVYTGSVQGTKAWSVYASDATAPSYFAGNVGIGTTAPAYKLDVAGAVNATSLLINGVAVGAGGSSPWMTNGTAIYNSNSGNVGIGTTAPPQLLSVNGTFGVLGVSTFGGQIRGLNGSAVAPTLSNSSDPTTGLFFTTPGGLGTINFATAGNERMRIDNAGNVGIGTTAPNSLLVVTGTDTASAVGTYGTSTINSTLSPAASETALSGVYNNGLYVNVNVPASNTKTLDQPSGISGNFISNSTASIYAISGVSGFTETAANAAVTGNAGGWFGSEADAGTTTNLQGIYSSSEAYGSGAVTNQVGLEVHLKRSGAGVTTNRYGVYLETPTGSATNDYGFYQTGTQKNYFAGNVGIGTTAPAYKLDVAGQVNATALSINGVAITSGGASAWATNGANIYNTNTGYVGIGTSTPLYPLVVKSQSAGRIGSFQNSSGTEVIALNEAGYGYLDVKTATGASSARLNAGGDSWLGANGLGNVGIGTTAPLMKLDIGGGLRFGTNSDACDASHKNELRTNSNGFQIDYCDGNAWTLLAMNGYAFNAVAGSAAFPGIGFVTDYNSGMWNPSYGSLAFSSNSLERLRILSNGNVGIGTTSPTQALEVAGIIKADAGMLNASGTLANPGYRFTADATTGFYLSTPFNLGLVTNGVDRLHLDGSGNVGIATTAPTHRLEVNGSFGVMNGNSVELHRATASTQTNNMVFYSDDTANAWYFGNPTAVDAFSVQHNGSPVIYANSSNNIGIGTTVPATALQVSGSATDSTITLTRAGSSAAAIWQYNGATMNFGTVQSDAVSFLTAGSTRMTITTAGNLGVGTVSPAGALDVTSTTGGVVLPRMTKAQRNAISSPVAGTAIYQTDNTPGLRVYNGTNWMRYTETAD